MFFWCISLYMYIAVYSCLSCCGPSSKLGCHLLGALGGRLAHSQVSSNPRINGTPVCFKPTACPAWQSDIWKCSGLPYQLMPQISAQLCSPRVGGPPNWHQVVSTPNRTRFGPTSLLARQICGSNWHPASSGSVTPSWPQPYPVSKYVL